MSLESLSVIDLERHIEQLNSIFVSKEEKDIVEKILSLKSILEDKKIKDLIKEDLHDESWIKDTQILIKTCEKRLEKELVVKEKINETKRVLFLKLLDSYLKNNEDLCLIKQSDKIIMKDESGLLFDNKKLRRVIEEDQNIKEILEKDGVLIINKDWVKDFKKKDKKNDKGIQITFER